MILLVAAAGALTLPLGSLGDVVLPVCTFVSINREKNWQVCNKTKRYSKVCPFVSIYEKVTTHFTPFLVEVCLYIRISSGWVIYQGASSLMLTSSAARVKTSSENLPLASWSSEYGSSAYCVPALKVNT